MPPPASRTAVLGGGIAGLSAAYYLAKSATTAAGAGVTLYEAGRRLGGWIQTEQLVACGFRFEKGPRTIRPVGPRGANTLRMIDDLQLSASLVPVSKSHVAAQNRMIYVNGALHSLPSSLGSMFRTHPPFSRPLIAAALTDLWTGRSDGPPLHDESIYAFAARRFGDETAKYLVSAMICGICAGDAKQISVKFLMDEVFRKEQKYGGVLRGVLCGALFEKDAAVRPEDEVPCDLVDRAEAERWSVYSFREGLEVLPQTLAERLVAQGVRIKSGMQCTGIRMEATGGATVSVTADSNTSARQFDHIISSLPSHRLAPLVAAQHSQLAAELAAIPYVDVALVNLQYDGDDLVQRPGFGFLVPPSENLPILGVIYDSCCFPQSGNTVLTVMMGGAWFAERLGVQPTNKQLYDIAVQQVADILGIGRPPQTGRVHVLQQCIPQYVVGHRDRVGRIREYIREHRLPLTLCGAAFDGVGVNDVIYSARQAVGERAQALEV